ncbi:DUF1573 domain-containing protein [Aquimarina hainanensis]|uniref:DUF1573 domain-containing protein n=1 Tax=Aquimarina hainanensis TaxID=1578017 RepID=A0ABW5NC32_9FLAO|nr:DUF1573 domain-containing protein [Aquimarina sp. TRL1]QKX03513.1 DUF1573 domain-containing protein [Aquimarina sp. TRL1]
MKNIMMILFVALLGTTINAQEAKAQIKFKTDVIDYGEIEAGSDGIREFEFTNTGSAPLIISRVYSSCGCTIPEKPKDPIAPGDNGVIKVKYDTKRVGPIRKTITVYSNAEESTKAIKIKGTVLAKK